MIAAPRIPDPAGRLRQLLEDFTAVVKGFELEALNGVICTPPNDEQGFPQWDAPVSRQWCSACRGRWRLLRALPNALAAGLREGAEARPQLSQNEQAWEDLRADGGLPESHPARGAFLSGWSAGFQEALTPDEHPDQDRGEVAYREWLKLGGLFNPEIPLAARPHPAEPRELDAYLDLIRAGAKEPETFALLGQLLAMQDERRAAAAPPAPGRQSKETKADKGDPSRGDGE